MTDDERIERRVDHAVRRRLARDAAYLNAANAEEQSAREEEITEEELRIARKAVEITAFRERTSDGPAGYWS